MCARAVTGFGVAAGRLPPVGASGRPGRGAAVVQLPTRQLPPARLSLGISAAPSRVNSGLADGALERAMRKRDGDVALGVVADRLEGSDRWSTTYGSSYGSSQQR